MSRSFQGIITKGIINSELQFEKLAAISGNVANMNTTGYKGVKFEQILNDQGYLTGIERRDYTQGDLLRTSNDFDVAIQGEGFIPITSPDGEVCYTRDGKFKIDPDGYLITLDGYLVGDGIQLPTNYENLRISPNGDVIVYSNDRSFHEVLGNIPVVMFPNQAELRAGDDNKFYITAESGEPILKKEGKKIVQGSQEGSNVNMMDSAYDVMRLNASITASIRIMTTVNQMYNLIVEMSQ